jgi:hypothetical protein
MTRLALVLGVGALLVSVGCNAPVDRSATERMTTLENRIASFEQRSADLALKTRIVSQLFGSPLDNFFAADEFWENTYDSGQADCARRCIATLTAERKACASEKDDAKRQQCYQAATDRASRCQVQCSQNNPPPFP